MRESTIIMLWMLVFLLLITFWVDMRLKNLREECLGHYLLLERLLANGSGLPGTSIRNGNSLTAPTRRDPQPTNYDANDDTMMAPWFDSQQSTENSDNTLLPSFIDDLVPTKAELSKALRGVSGICGTVEPTGKDQWVYPGKREPIISGTSLNGQLEGYDETHLYAPAWI